MTVTPSLEKTLGLRPSPPTASDTTPARNGNGRSSNGHAAPADDRQPYLHRCIHLQLLSLGLPAATAQADPAVLEIASGLLANYRQKSRLLDEYRCPADRRIESFLQQHLADLNLPWTPRLPGDAFVLDQHGVARELSLPQDRDEHESPLLKSYRVTNGVLHNPRSDRRTTKGTFHVAEGGLPIPDDKVAVPKAVFAEMFRHAVNPPRDLRILPFTATQPNPAAVFCSLLLRPLVRPEIPGVSPRKTMEVRFFSPGSLVSNLDFVESIFGNAGDPMLPDNDAGLDVEHWTGHTGCVILAPHLCHLTKKELGLPHADQATERQRRDRQCWSDPNEKYNNGDAFKLTCRTEQGVIVTLIADNYFGYCKKEVKTQISYATNLMGNAEEEHAGGALVFPSYNLGDEYVPHARYSNGRTFANVVSDYGDRMTVHPDGYAVDNAFPNVLYVPEDATLTLRSQTVSWTKDGQPRSLPLLTDHYYVTPWGSKIYLDKHPASGRFRLIVTVGEGTFCHKPCTVSGGGKSEISKSLHDYMIYGPVYVGDLGHDMDEVQKILDKDHAKRWAYGRAPQDYSRKPARPILGPDRTLGSVVKLLTPSPDYNDEYNAWLESIPSHIFSLVFLIKRLYKPEWGTDWRSHFTVDIINGDPGHELKVDDKKAGGSYLRVGFDQHGTWKTYRLRQDFYPAMKVQTEDDISASTVVPADWLSGLGVSPNAERGTPNAERDSSSDGVRSAASQSTNARPETTAPNTIDRSSFIVHRSAFSLKLVENCEYRLFQRPDDAIHPGFDKQAELDIARTDNFLSNFEPLTPDAARQITHRITEFDAYTAPMKHMIQDGAHQQGGYVAVSAYPRIVDGKPTKNPRYLQIRLDLQTPIGKHLAEIGQRLARGIPADKPVVTPVDAVLFGRRNNPGELKDEGKRQKDESDHGTPAPSASSDSSFIPHPSSFSIRPLAVYNPIHYQELPELFMDFICSLTGKSPSTTGAGSEGALTKGPFNALLPTADLNTALVSYILTGLGGFSTAAGYVGPDGRVDHDLSLMVPELWCRLRDAEREPAYMIENALLEKLEDFEHNGRTIPASRLGYRITYQFVRTFFGRLFANPNRVFDDRLLKPETQDFDAYVDGILNIAETQQRVAKHYFDDGSIAQAVPPLQALLHIMAHGHYKGMSAHHPDVRRMFTRDALLASDWYHQRLTTKQQRDITLWQRHVDYLTDFAADDTYADDAARLRVSERLATSRAELARVSSPDYVRSLVGTVGADPMKPIALP
jgi:hypothetical protein